MWVITMLNYVDKPSVSDHCSLEASYSGPVALVEDANVFFAHGCCDKDLSFLVEEHIMRSH